MAVTVAYSVDQVDTLDTGGITADADVAALANGGVVVVGALGGATDGAVSAANGDPVAGLPALAGTEAAVSQLSNGNIVIAVDAGNQASFAIVDGSGGVIVPLTGGSGVLGSGVLNVDVAGGVLGDRFVIVSQAFYSGTDNDIRVNIRNNDGSSVTGFAVDNTGADDQRPSVAVLNDGSFVVAWHRNVGGSSQLWYAVYEAGGVTTSSRSRRAMHPPAKLSMAAPTWIG